MRRHRTPERDDRGVVALEFVAVLPVLVALIMCIVTVAGIFQTKSRVVGAARDGARALALKPGVATPNADPNPGDGITVVRVGLPCPSLTDPAYQTASPPKVEARASTTYTVDIPFIGKWTDVPVEEKATMPCG